MILRRAALLAAISAGCNALYALGTWLPHIVRGQIPLRLAFLIPPVGLLCFWFSLGVFFGFLFAEGSRRMGSSARAKAALAATVLMSITIVCVAWETGNIISTCRAPNAHCAFSVPVAVLQSVLFNVLASVGWAVFFVAFAEKVHVFRGNVVPKLAVLLAIWHIADEWFVFTGPGSPLALVNIVSDGLDLCTTIALVIFAVVLYRKWDSHKPIHDTILGGMLQLNPKQDP